MGAYMRSALPDEQGYEPVDTLESPMWVVVRNMNMPCDG